MSDTLSHLVVRLRQVWFDTVKNAARFVLPAGMSVVLTLDDLGSSRMVATLLMLVEQIFKSFVRGILPVGIAAFALYQGAHTLAARVGSLGRPVLETFVILMVIRDALPLGVALFVSVRQGAALTTKYALDRGAATPAKQRTIAPYLAAATIASTAFYLVLAGALLWGYLEGGPLRGVGLDTLDALTSESLRVGYFLGIGKSALFGLVVAWLALALGWFAGIDEPPTQPGRDHPTHYLVWEASSFALGICVVLTLLVGKANPLKGISL